MGTNDVGWYYIGEHMYTHAVLSLQSGLGTMVLDLEHGYHDETEDM